MPTTHDHLNAVIRIGHAMPELTGRMVNQAGVERVIAHAEELLANANALRNTSVDLASV